MCNHLQRHTLATCSKCSTDRIVKLWQSLLQDIGVPEKSLSCHLVIVAPNCGPDKFARVTGNQCDFCFSAPTVLGSRKRKMSGSGKQRKPKSSKF